MTQVPLFLQQLVNIFSTCDFLMIVITVIMCAIFHRRNPKKAYGNVTKICGKGGGASLGGRSTESTEVDSDSDKLNASGTDTDESSVRLRAQRSSCAKHEANTNIPQNRHVLSLDKVLSGLMAEDAKSTELLRTTKPPWAERWPSNDEFLKKLAEIDPKRILMVRRIKEFGLKSPEILKTYFSKFGLVENVYVSHSVDKRHLDADPQAQPIIVPGGYGYIVMEKVDDVFNIFQHGLRHTISGVPVPVTAYEHHVPDEVGRIEDPRRKGHRFPTYANFSEDNNFVMNMRKIAEMDEKRVFMVRRIHKLGFGSAEMLKTHFEKIGAVTNVFVTHNLDKRRVDPTNPNPRGNVRPAGLGFVVMETAEDVVTVLRAGTEQTVFNVQISLSPYTHRNQAEASLEASTSGDPK
jgi:hypothetical protein